MGHSIREHKLGINTNAKGLLIKGADAVAPLALLSGALILISYLSDLISGGEITLGEGSALSKVLLYFGLTVQGLIAPVASAIISKGIGGTEALPSGIICGYIAQKGLTLQSPMSNTNNTTGIFGGILAGLSAGLIYLLIKKLMTFFKLGSQEAKTFISVLVSFILSAAVICSINAVAGIIRFLLSVLLSSVTKSGNKLLLCILTGALIPADPSGVFHLSAYDNATSSLSQGGSDIMASAMAAMISTSLGAGISSVILRKKLSAPTRLSSVGSLLLASGGIDTGVIPLYIASPFKSALSFIPGGIISALISQSAHCEIKTGSGGFLSINSVTVPLMFVLASVCGGILSSAIFILLHHRSEQPVNSDLKSKTGIL